MQTTCADKHHGCHKSENPEWWVPQFQIGQKVWFHGIGFKVKGIIRCSTWNWFETQDNYSVQITGRAPRGYDRFEHIWTSKNSISIREN